MVNGGGGVRWGEEGIKELPAFSMTSYSKDLGCCVFVVDTSQIAHKCAFQGLKL